MIAQYSNDIYPMDLWVGTTNDTKCAEKNFLFYYSVTDLKNETPIEDCVIKELTTQSGVTYIVKHKKPVHAVY